MRAGHYKGWLPNLYLPLPSIFHFIILFWFDLLIDKNQCVCKNKKIRRESSQGTNSGSDRSWSNRIGLRKNDGNDQFF